MGERQFIEKYGPWALVTGATSGIGKEMAEQLATRGCNVVLVARHEDMLQAEAGRIRSQHGVETRTITADLGTPLGYQAVVDGTRDIQIGLLVPCAGTVTHGHTTDIDLEQELALVQLNVSSVMALSHHFTRLMAARGKGGVLFVASISGHMPGPYFSNYSGSKAYILNYAKSIYWELKRKGVDISILSPGHTDTPMIQLEDMDFRKSPLFIRSPSVVARAGINALGKRLVVVPGIENRISIIFFSLLPSRMAAAGLGWLIKRMYKRKIQSR